MAELTDDQKLNKALTDQVAALTKEKQEAQATITSLTAAKDKAEGDLATATKVVVDLKEKLADKAAGTVKLDTVKVGEDTYELTSDFFYKGAEVSIEVLKENTELAAELVKEGVGNLRKVVAKTKAK